MQLQKVCTVYGKQLLYCIRELWIILNDLIEKAARQEREETKEQEEETEGNINLTSTENQRDVNASCRSFIYLDYHIDGDSNHFKPHIRTLIKGQLKEMQSAKVIMTLQVR